MVIISKLSQQDYINVSFVLLFKKVIVRIFLVMVACGLLAGILTAIFNPEAFEISKIIPISLFLIFFFTLFYFINKQNYSRNKRVSETVEYLFDNDYLNVKGESYNSKLTWNKVYKVTKTKNWVLIWHTYQSATPINKRDIQDKQVTELKEILNKQGVKNNL